MKTPFPSPAPLFLGIFFLIAGWSMTIQAEPVPEIILRLHGSNTIGAKLVPAIAMAFLKENLKAETVRLQPGKENELVLLADLPTGTVGVEIAAHGSSTGFKDLAAGGCDIAMSSRAIKEKEKVGLASLGNMDSFQCEHVLGLDGIAVIVHPANPNSSMPLQAIHDIFTGKITEWEQLSSDMHGHIEVHARDDKSGTYDTFKSLVLGEDAPLSASAVRHESNAKLSDTVADNPLAIGFTGLPYIQRAKALSLSDASAPPIFPDRNTVGTEDYALARRLYLYSPSRPKNIYSSSFIDFALSERGQELVASIGFVDLNIKTYAAAWPDQAPPQKKEVVQALEKAVMQKERATLNFRFKPGSSQLDNRAERDLARLSRVLSSNPEQQVVLIGFSDSIGDYNSNLTLSLKRAGAVNERLRELGLKNTCRVIGAGEEMPIASNSDDMGKEKNRRVEVWLSPVT